MATWTPVGKLSGAPSVTYDNATYTYDSILLNYEGQLTTVWTPLTKN